MKSTLINILLGCAMAGAIASQPMAAGLPSPSALANGPGAEAPPAPAQTASPPPKAAASRHSGNVRRPKTERDYIGKWIGVEGLLLHVARGTNGKLVVYNIWSTDEHGDQGSFDAEVVPQGLRWTRQGTTVVGRPSNGAATGLKWLDGRKDCLTVAQGEGYCRD